MLLADVTVACRSAGGLPVVFHRAGVSNVHRPGDRVDRPDSTAHGLRDAAGRRTGEPVASQSSAPVFAAARWCPDAVGLALVDVIVAWLLPADSPIAVVVDDTLFKRSGRKVFGTAWHHDGTAKGPKPIGFGNCWATAGQLLGDRWDRRGPAVLSRPVCLPVLARLWRPRRTAKLAHAREMAELIAARHADRAVHVVGDAAYVGEQLRGLSRQITWTSRLKVTSVLHALAPPRTGRSGRPRTKGDRLGTPSELAAAATWHTAQVRRYGRTDTVQITELVCRWCRPVVRVLPYPDRPRGPGP